MSLLDALLAPFSSDGLMVELLWQFGAILIVVVALDLVMGYTGMFQLGHIGFFALGALGTTYGTHPDYLGLDLFSGLLLGWLFTSAAVLLIGLPTLRLTGDYFAIATLGFGLSTQFALLAFYSNGVFGVPSMNPLGCDTDCLAGTEIGGEVGHFVITLLSLEDVARPERTGIELLFLFVAVVATYVLIGRLKHAPFGRTLKSVREDRRAAEALGKNTQSLRLQALWISALAQSLAGSLVVHHRGILSPVSFGFEFLILTLLAVIVGGLGSHFAAIIGVLAVVVLNEVSKSFSTWLGGEAPVLNEAFSVAALRVVLFGGLLVAIMILRPQGILGERDITLRGLLARLRGRPQETVQTDPEGARALDEPRREDDP